MLRSLLNRLALVFFAITLVAIGGLYLYIAPGLETRLVNEKLKALATAAQRDIPERTRSTVDWPRLPANLENASTTLHGDCGQPASKPMSRPGVQAAGKPSP